MSAKSVQLIGGSSTVSVDSSPIPIKEGMQIGKVKVTRTVWRQLFVFCMCFVSYAIYHAHRKTTSGCKSHVKAAWTNNTYGKPPFMSSMSKAKDFLGNLDGIFMFAYSFSLFFFGWLGDRVSVVFVHSLGMIGGGIALVVYGSIPVWAKFNSVPYYVITYIFFGLAQGCGHSSVVAILSNWFGPKNRGFILGLWASCQPVGNIFGSLLTGAVVDHGYQWAYVLNSSIIFAFGFVFFLVVPETPTAEEWAEINDHDDDEEAKKEGRPPGVALSFWKAVLLPSVGAYCLCNVCIKFVNYAFFFWLPLYLSDHFNWKESKADDLSTWYDVGGIIGSVVIGYVSVRDKLETYLGQDLMGYRSPLIVGTLTGSLLALFVYSKMGANMVLNAAVMLVVGITCSGPYNLIVSTISVDLGAQIGDNERAMSTVAGLVDGAGSLGSGVGQFLLPHIQDGWGWKSVFYIFIVMNFIGILCLLRRLFDDIRRILKDKREGRNPWGRHNFLNQIPEKAVPAWDSEKAASFAPTKLGVDSLGNDTRL